jgi:hypothetical protein
MDLLHLAASDVPALDLIDWLALPLKDDRVARIVEPIDAKASVVRVVVPGNRDRVAGTVADLAQRPGARFVLIQREDP